MPIHLLQIILVLCSIDTQATAAVAAAESLALPGCEDKCGNISIPYPFGIGANCSATKSFTITCSTNSFGVPTPAIDVGMNLEVLQISLRVGTIQVRIPVVGSDCTVYDESSKNRVGKLPEDLAVDLSSTPFTFSYLNSRFTALGCDTFALMIDRRGNKLGGCMSFCNSTSNDSSCSGVNCCQTTIPRSLNFINVSLGSIDPTNLRRYCSYAFMVDREWFSGLRNPLEVKRMATVPVALDWISYRGNCESFGDDDSYSASSTSTNASSLCGPNAECSSSGSCRSKRVYDRPNGCPRGSCHCRTGYGGNPYLPNGCQDIDECANPRDNSCGKICVNTEGSYRCSCPSGYELYGRYSCYKQRDSRKMAIIGTGTGLAGLVLIIGAWRLCKIMKRRRRMELKKKFFKRNGGLLLEQQLSSGEEGNVDKTKIFTSKELEKATDQYNQNRILGQGGQGTVYKGMLTDGRIVAIKKSKIEDEGRLEQFINEVAILSQINHRNVVKLHGCCLETEVPMLVYEFIPNGTLFQYIHNENPEFPLSWDMRLQIAIEVAGALSYLHSAASVPIYHRDIKSTNILLDEKFRAKVADFGTSRSIAIDQTHITTKVLGTVGYLDPEYFQSSQFTEKSDVYSFGVVLVELLTGEKAISSTKSEEGRSLVLQFISAIKENHLSDILDARVAREGAQQEIRGVADLAKRCLNLNGKKRPTMREVATDLERIRKLNEAEVQEPLEDEVEHFLELPGPSDTGSSSTLSFTSNSVSTSLDVQPLLFN